jgi:hypothetical protein
MVRYLTGDSIGRHPGLRSVDQNIKDNNGDTALKIAIKTDSIHAVLKTRPALEGPASIYCEHRMPSSFFDVFCSPGTTR